MGNCCKIKKAKCLRLGEIFNKNSKNVLKNHSKRNWLTLLIFALFFRTPYKSTNNSCINPINILKPSIEHRHFQWESLIIVKKVSQISLTPLLLIQCEKSIWMSNSIQASSSFKFKESKLFNEWRFDWVLEWLIRGKRK